MTKLLILLCMAPLLMAMTCENDLPHRENPCTAIAVAGITVNVSLNGNSNVSADGISVSARDGNYIEDLYAFQTDVASFSGLYERSGSYVITVRKEGFVDFVSVVLLLSSDRCHVIPQHLNVNLISE